MKLIRRPIRRASKPALSLAVVAMVAAIASTPAVAQDAAAFGYSVLGAVPATGTLSTPEVLEGTLVGTDLRSTAGVRFQVFEFEGEQGSPLSIDVQSTDFDAYLFLVGPGFDDVMTDDDSGGACNARLTVFLPGTGTYRVAAGSLGGDSGSFTLRLDTREHPAVQGECGGGGDYAAAMASLESQGFVDVGGEVTGDLLIDGPTLPDESPAAAWDLVGTPGQTVYIDLISEEFDAVVFASGVGIAGHMQDDDSGGGCNSRLELAISSDEPYRIVASALGAGQGGLYTLRVSETPQPLSTDSCY